MDAIPNSSKIEDRSAGNAAVYDSANETSNRFIARFGAGAFAGGAAAYLAIEYGVAGVRTLAPLVDAAAMLAVALVLMITDRVKLKPRTETYILQAYFILAIPLLTYVFEGLNDAAIWAVAFIFLIASLMYVRPTFIIITIVTVISTQSVHAVLQLLHSRPESLVELLVRYALIAIAAVLAVAVNKSYSRQLSLNLESNARLKKELGQSGERMRILGLYTRRSLVQIVESGNDPAAIQPEIKDMAVMFCDIREFARLSQKMEPRTLISILNEFYEAMGFVINQRGGEIDKLIGDCIMATFPDADSALTAAVEMKEALFELNACNRQGGLPSLRTGIGVHFGTVVVGNLGSREKMDLTIIGDTVNVASRIEALTKFYITDVIVSEDFKARLSVPMKMRYIDTVRVKGRDDSLRLYEVYHHHRAETVVAKEKDAGRMDSAMRLYAEGHFSDAISLLLQVGEKVGDHETLIGFYRDPLINVLLDRSISLFQRQKTGDLPSWDGIFRFQEK